MTVAGGGRMLFSVVVCTYNRARVVPRALESVLAQDMDDFELVVVDDGSTDDTAAVLADFTRRGVRYVHRPNGGLSAARNTGLAHARGEYVIFLDDDDRVEPHWLSSLAAVADDSTGIVSCGFRGHAPDGTVLHDELPAVLPAHFDGHRAVFQAGTFAARRLLYDEAGGYAEAIPIAHQTEVALRLMPLLAAHGMTVGTVDAPLVHVELRPAADRSWRPADNLAGAEYLLRHHRERLSRSPETKANYHAVAAVAAFHAGDRATCRRHLRAAVRTDPRNLRHLGRLALAYTPLAGRVWKRSRPTDGPTAGPASRPTVRDAPTPGGRR